MKKSDLIEDLVLATSPRYRAHLGLPERTALTATGLRAWSRTDLEGAHAALKVEVIEGTRRVR